MKSAPLSSKEQAGVQRALAFLRHGKPREAAAELAPYISAGHREPQILIPYATACEKLGLLTEAVGACRAAVESSGGSAVARAMLGRLLHRQGDHIAAIAELEQAVAVEPNNPEYSHNLGIAQLAAGLLPQAATAIERVTILAPEWSMGWSALGRIRQAQGMLDDAERCLAKAVGLDPALRSARHNLAVVLRQLDRPAEAMEHLSAMADPPPESRLIVAHLAGDLGRPDEAVERYRRLLRDRPQLTEAHETLARLLPQLGRSSEALDSYREAMSAQPSLELYHSALGSARDLKDSAAMFEWVAEGERRFGESPQFTAFRGLAHGIAGETEEALNVLEPLADGGFVEVRSHCAYYRLKLGDLGPAEAHALAATRVDPTDQPAWAYLSLIWRLNDDGRETWLADYERLVMPIDLDPPAGYSHADEFMRAVAEDLGALHATLHAPAEQSLRHGTQTRGALFDRKLESIQALKLGVERQLTERLAALPADSSHPFLSRNNEGKLRFDGSWSVRLRSGGFHIHHIHHCGWLSSALHVALPDSMVDAVPGGPGSLIFGVPDAELGLDLPPRRVEAPKVGRLIVFPSYFWHGTVPFDSDQPRLTVAFDALPD